MQPGHLANKYICKAYSYSTVGGFREKNILLGQRAVSKIGIGIQVLVELALVDTCRRYTRAFVQAQTKSFSSCLPTRVVVARVGVNQENCPDPRFIPCVRSQAGTTSSHHRHGQQHPQRGLDGVCASWAMPSRLPPRRFASFFPVKLTIEFGPLHGRTTYMNEFLRCSCAATRHLVVEERKPIDVVGSSSRRLSCV